MGSPWTEPTWPQYHRGRSRAGLAISWSGPVPGQARAGLAGIKGKNITLKKEVLSVEQREEKVGLGRLGNSQLASTALPRSTSQASTIFQAHREMEAPQLWMDMEGAFGVWLLGWNPWAAAESCSFLGLIITT